jgi:hypothetical protein
MDQLKKAKEELSQAWKKACDAENEGLAFGKKCYDWSIKLGEQLYPVYKELGIRPTDANWWMEKYKTSAGLKDLHKEKRPNRSSPNTFSDIQSMALKLLGAGFSTLSKQEPEKLRLLQAAKDWAHSRLSRTDL